MNRFEFIMKKHLIYIVILCCLAIVGCKERNSAGSQVVSSSIVTQRCTDSVAFMGKWRLVSITDGGKNTKPAINDTLVINDCSSIIHHSGGKTWTDEFKLYKMVNYCADYQLVFKNDSLGCMNVSRDTLIICQCSDLENMRYYFKRIM